MSLFGFTAYRYINLRRLTHRRPMRILYLNHVLIWFYSRSLYTLETPDTQASNENLLFKSCDLYSLLLLVELLYRPVWRYQPSLSLQVRFKRATRIFTSKQSTLLKNYSWYSDRVPHLIDFLPILGRFIRVDIFFVARDTWRKMAASVEPGGKAVTRGLSDKR